MSQRSETTASKSDQWKALDSAVPSASDIDKIYAEVWTDRKNSSTANLTPIERMQYERQNSAGRPMQNEQFKPLCDDFKIHGTDCQQNDKRPDDGAAKRAEHHTEKACRSAGISHEPYRFNQGNNFYQRNDQNFSAKPENCSPEQSKFSSAYGRPYSHRDPETDGPFPRPLLPYDRAPKVDGHIPRPLLPYDKAPNDKAPKSEELDRLPPLKKPDDKSEADKLTQKVCYPDGSSRVVLRNPRGEITAVVNPDGSRLERQESSDGKSPTWKAYSKNDTEITADSFRGQVDMKPDGTYRMLKTYPVPQIYEQKPDGSYRHAYKGGAETQWSASEQTQTVLYPTGKARVISYKPDSKGILRESGVKNR